MKTVFVSGVDPDHPDFKENLAKAIVATFQMNRPKKEQDPFSVKLARSEAKQLMNLPTFKRFTESPALVRKYLNDDKLFQVCGGLFRPFHLTQKDKAFDILSALSLCLASRLSAPGLSESIFELTLLSASKTAFMPGTLRRTSIMRASRSFSSSFLMNSK